MPPARLAAPNSAFTDVALEGGLDAALERLPAAPGVGHILGEGDRSLVVGRPANLRRWLATNLGRAVVKKGQRPPTDLTPVARVVRFAVATSGFHHRLLFERLIARYVPASARRDLKTPGYLHLDAAERFPRVTAQAGGAGRPDLIGPFRDRAAATRARDAVHKLFPLRPCDYRFEPDPELPLGLGCLYAQVRTCAAPCLARVGEPEYRALAREAVAVVVGEAEVAAAAGAMEWTATAVPGADEAWFAAWLHERKRSGRYVIVPGEGRGPALTDVLRAALD